MDFSAEVFIPISDLSLDYGKYYICSHSYNKYKLITKRLTKKLWYTFISELQCEYREIWDIG